MCVFRKINTEEMTDEQRQALYLEMENDEYNYGHNVDHKKTDDDGNEIE